MSGVVSIPLFLSFGRPGTGGMPSLPVEAILYEFVASGKFEEMLRNELGMDVKIEKEDGEFILYLNVQESKLLEVRKTLSGSLFLPPISSRIHIQKKPTGSTVTILAGVLYHLKSTLRAFGDYTPSSLLVAAGELARIMEEKTYLHLPGLIEVMAEKEVHGVLVSTVRLTIDSVPEHVLRDRREEVLELRRRISNGESVVYETPVAVSIYLPYPVERNSVWCLRLLKRPVPSYIKTLQLLDEITTIIAPFLPSAIPKLARVLNECRSRSWMEQCRLLAEILSMVVIALGA